LYAARAARTEAALPERCYDPLTSRGLAARDFGMSTLLIDLLANCGTDTDAPSATRRMMRP
jgi:hypothetical protein